MIVLQELSRSYGPLSAVDGISLDVARGECVFLVGGSGCGKTTTLKMINRLVEPSAGRVLVDGTDHREIESHALRRQIGYGFQQVGLFPHMSVAGNVSVTPELLGWAPERIRSRVDELLELMELDPAEYRERMPHELSGGQQQRVGLARALAAEPQILLLDEPFGALDPLTRDRLQQRFSEIRARLGLTVMFVSHDMSEALLLADRIAVMDAGRFVQVGTPHELMTAPADDHVSELIASPRRQSEAVERILAAKP